MKIGHYQSDPLHRWETVTSSLMPGFHEVQQLQKKAVPSVTDTAEGRRLFAEGWEGPVKELGLPLGN